MTVNGFDHPRIAPLLDVLDSDRSDLNEYRNILLKELHAESVLDLGSGTGILALQLAEAGVKVTGVEPAGESLKVAQSKPGAEKVTWFHGVIEDFTPVQVDAAVMSANVAMVFLTDQEWASTLRSVAANLKPGGSLLFSFRNIEDRAWERWTKERTHSIIEVPNVGTVEDWVQTTNVDGELVTFDSPTVFRADGTKIVSTVTLRFRTRDAIEDSLRAAGFEVTDVRDLLYAPGRGWMYIAKKALGA